MNQICSVCKKEFEQEDSVSNLYDSCVVCNEHTEFAEYFFPEILMKERKMISEYPYRMRQCCVCQTELTDEDEKSLNKRTSLITCENHREVQYWFQQDIAKLWFDFKKENPDAEIDSVHDRRKFAHFREERANF